MQSPPQAKQPSQWDMQTEVPKAMKFALDVSTLRNYLSRRAQQGVGGAEALGKQLPTSGTSRGAVGQMSGLQKHRMQNVMSSGKDVRGAEGLAGNVGLGAQKERLYQAAQTPVPELRAGGMEMGRRGREFYPEVRNAAGVLEKSPRSYLEGSSYGPQGISKMTGLSVPEGEQVVKSWMNRKPAAPPKINSRASLAPTQAGVNPLGRTQASVAPAMPAPSSAATAASPIRRRQQPQASL